MKAGFIARVWLCPPVCLDGESTTHDPRGKGVLGSAQEQVTARGNPNPLLQPGSCCTGLGGSAWKTPTPAPLPRDKGCTGSKEGWGAGGATQTGDSSSAHTCRPPVCRQGAGGAGKDGAMPRASPRARRRGPLWGSQGPALWSCTIPSPSGARGKEPMLSQATRTPQQLGCHGGHTAHRGEPSIPTCSRGRDPLTLCSVLQSQSLHWARPGGGGEPPHAWGTPRRGRATCPEQPGRAAGRFISMSQAGNGPDPPPRAAQWRAALSSRRTPLAGFK